MENANQEDAHSPTVSQQQELIKLIAQHFHHQFYQLARGVTSNNVAYINGSSSNATTANNSASDFSRGAQMGCQFLLPAASPPMVPAEVSFAYAPPGGVTARSGQPNNSCGLDLSCLEMLAPNHRGQHPSHEQALRSQQHDSSMIAHSQPALIDFSNQSNMNPYPFDQFSIMNALAIGAGGGVGGGSSCSPVFARQQQQQQPAAPLVQAAHRNVRHPFGAAGGGGGGILDGLASVQQAGSINLLANRSSIQAEANSEQILNGKSLLKFSINTILGRCSTPKSETTNCEMTNSVCPRRNGALSGSTMNGGARPAGFSDGPIESYNCNANQVRADGDQLGSGSGSSSPSAPPTTRLARGSNPKPSMQAAHKGRPRAASAARANTGCSSLGAIGHQQHSVHHAPQSALNGSHSLAPFLANPTAFSWTVTSRGKPRRGMMRRAVFSDGQRVGLEKRFQMQKYISKPERKKLAEKLGLRDSQVKIWFQNRRMKWRNSKERELLSTGGTREQTLPTRNNPNPDLSDVGETIRKLTLSTEAAASAATTSSNKTNK